MDPGKLRLNDMTMDVAFYQLSKTPIERALPKLLEKVYTSGLRVLVLCENKDKMDLMNNTLWTFSSGAFLPHGYEGDPLRHPIWLSLSPDNVNTADIILVTSGLMIPPSAPYKKCLDMFDGSNDEKVQQARVRYMEYQTRQCPLTFWKQDDEGAWKKQG